MPQISKDDLKAQLGTFFDTVGAGAIGSGLKALPVVGDLALAGGGDPFATLEAQILAAVDAAKDTGADLATRLNKVAHVTATTDVSGALTIALDDTETLSVAGSRLGFEAGVSGASLSLGGNVSSTLSAALKATLAVAGGTPTLTVVHQTGPELALALASEVSFDASAELGILKLTATDKDPTAPEAKLTIGLDVADGSLATPPAAATRTVGGSAGFDLQLEAGTVAGSLLPELSTELLVTYDALTGKPLIQLKDIAVGFGPYLGGLIEAFKDVKNAFDKFPVGIIFDLVEAPLPIISQLLQVFYSGIDAAPPDGHISLSDIAADAIGGEAGEAIKAFFTVKQVVDQIGGLQISKDGEIVLGTITVTGSDPAHPGSTFQPSAGASALQQFTGLLGQSGNTTLTNFLGNPANGLHFPLLEHPERIADLFLDTGSPVPLVAYQFPELKLEAEASLSIPIFGPISLKLFGGVGASLNVGVGFDTSILTGGTGVYITELDAAGNDARDTIPLAGFGVKIGAGAELNAFALKVSADGFIGLDVNGYVADGPDYPNGVHLDQIDTQFIDPITGRAYIGIRLTISFGFGPFKFKQTIPVADVTIVDFDAIGGSPKTEKEPADEHALAVLREDGHQLLLNTGGRADERQLGGVERDDDGNPTGPKKGDDDKEPDTFQVTTVLDPATGAPKPGQLQVLAFGASQILGTAGTPLTEIKADLGELRDSLLIDASVLQPASISGGNKEDYISGGSGNDTLKGDDQDDYLLGNAGDDTLKGGDDDDELDGGKGADLLDGGSERDQVTYRVANGDSQVGVRFERARADVRNQDGKVIAHEGDFVGHGGDAEGDILVDIEHLTGTAFGDQLQLNGDGDFVLDGLAGRDTLIGGEGDDLLIGGPGADTLIGSPRGSDTGFNVISYYDSYGGVVVDLGRHVAYGGDADGDTFLRVQGVIGSGNDDGLTGDGEANKLYGFLGNDTLSGAGGEDTVDGGDGDDLVYGGTDGDDLDGGSGIDLLSFAKAGKAVEADLGAGTLTGGGKIEFTTIAGFGGTVIRLTGTSSFENLDGSRFPDKLTGDRQSNVIRGFAGDDTLDGGAGDDTLIGGPGRDSMTGGPGTDLVSYAGAAAGVIAGLNGVPGSKGEALGDVIGGVENLVGSDYADILTGSASDPLVPFSGNNLIDPGLSRGGRDLVIGLTGEDTLRLDYAVADDGEGMTGGYSLGSVASGSIQRLGTGGGVLDGVTFSGIERLFLTGTIRADRLYGGAGADRFATGTGDDTVTTGLGDDVVLAGRGNDLVAYGTGADRQLSATGGRTGSADSVFRLDGGEGIDTLSISLAGLSRNLRIAGAPAGGEFEGENLSLGSSSVSNFEILKDVSTGSGNDSVTQLGRYDNVLKAGDGNDTLTPGLGFDSVDGGRNTAGLAFLPGIPNTDITDRYAISDAAAFAAGTGDRLVLDYSGLTGDARVVSTVTSERSDLPGLALYDSRGSYSVRNGALTTDKVDFSGIESFRVVGSKNADTLTGADADYLGDVETGGKRIDRPTGADRLDGGAGNDTLLGRTGNDTLIGGLGDDVLVGSTLPTATSAKTRGTDVSEIDELTGGAGADTFVVGTFGGRLYIDPLSDISNGSPNSHAIIKDFRPGEGDRIQLYGKAADYRVAVLDDGVTTAIYSLRDHATASGAADATTGAVTPLVFNPGPTYDLVATVEGTTGFNLTAGYVSYVPTIIVVPFPLAGGAAAAPVDGPSPSGSELAAISAVADTLPLPILAAAPPASDASPAAVPAATSWVRQTSSAADLLTALGAGSGVVPGSASITVEGASEGIGTFDGDPFGLGKGVILSTGRVVDLPGANTDAGGATPATKVQLHFEKIGSVRGDSAVYRADLSGLHVDLNSLTFTDANRGGGDDGIASGFDLDAVVLSRTKLGPITDPNLDLDSASVLPRLTVPVGGSGPLFPFRASPFLFDAAHLHFTPGTQADNADGGRTPGPDLIGSRNGLVDNAVASLNAFSDDGSLDDALSLGVGGSLGIDLAHPVSTDDGPLYLYVAEQGGAGEQFISDVNVSASPVQPSGDLSADLGTPGLADDATKLTYTFTPTAAADVVRFQFVLFSEEFPEFAGTQPADSFKISLNGVQMAVLADGKAAEINYMLPGPGATPDPSLVLNPVGTGPLAGKVKADGYTRTLTFEGRVDHAGPNTLVVEVADHRDAYLDSGILLKGATFLTAGTLDTNGAPYGLADYLETVAGKAFVANVLANDGDPDGDAIAATLVKGADHGAATLQPDGTLSYVPNPGFVGQDVLSYRVGDGKATSGEVFVTVQVAPGTEPSGPYIDFDLSKDATDPGEPRSTWLYPLTNLDYRQGAYAASSSAPNDRTGPDLARFRQADGDTSVQKADFAGATSVDPEGVSPALSLDWTGNDAVLTLETPWDSVKNLELKAFTGDALRVVKFVDVVADWSAMTTDADLTLDGAKRSDIGLGSGDDKLLILADSDGPAFSNVHRVSAGGGDDAVTLGVSAVDYAGQAFGTTYDPAITQAVFAGGSGDDSLTGGAGADRLDGGADDDILVGGAGADTLVGGTGDDTIYVDDVGDVVTEAAGGGTDLVSTSSSWTVTGGSEIERLVATGTANVYLTGNAHAMRIEGNAGINSLDDGGAADTLAGATGSDVYIVHDAGTQVQEGASAGYDLVRTDLASFALPGNVEALTFVGTGPFTGTGNGLGNGITGGDGADTLDGGKGIGADRLTGGKGDDVYLTHAAIDFAAEKPGEGTDTIRTDANSAVANPNVEKLVFMGTGNFTGFAAATATGIVGGAGNDGLYGAAGNDTLDAGAGTNTLKGNGGADDFVLTPADNGVARIVDFVHGLDRLAIKVAPGVHDFGLVTAAPAPNAAEIQEYFTYDGGTGKLTVFTETSAAGPYASHLIATFDTKPLLSASDFHLV